jgi:NhaP-type Na+/H+ or K+/H+ antiporter
MDPSVWYLVAGFILVLLALSSTLIDRAPASPAMIYLALGVALGPLGADVIRLDVADDAHMIELLAELAVLISVFNAGLKMATSVADGRWALAVRLAFVAVPLTVVLLAGSGMLGWGLSVGAAVLLAGIVAPTDPVLASAVQVSHEKDRDKLRFSLTGEAGLNDGTAFPFVILGIILATVGNHPWLWLKWISLDVVWAVLGGLALGAVCGTVIGRLVVFLRTRHQEALGLDEFLALGLIALANGIAGLLSVYGFLAVFAAGLALRRIATSPPTDVRTPGPVPLASAVSHPATAPAALANAMLDLNSSLERLAEVGVVFLTGVLIGSSGVTMEAVLFAALLLFVVRPVSIALTLWRTNTTPMHRALIGWFGVRGVGSLYYLGYAGAHGIAGAEIQHIGAIVLVTIFMSVIVHGISVTPLMRWYDSHRRARSNR